MRRLLRNIYFFLPVQLLLLHFRKYRLLLVFWLLLYFTITGNLASHYGAYSLFLAPEYLGYTNFTGMYLLGGALCVFMMTWHITTFIAHSKRMPYMGATRQAFIIYSINNSIVPVVFLIFYSTISVRFMLYEENYPVGRVLLLQSGLYLGLTSITFLSFAYFFSVSRDSFKSVVSKITNPSRIRDIVPYDSLDLELDIIPARSFISGKLRIERSTDLEPYHPRVLGMVLRRHHRNVIFGTFICYVLLVLLGSFKEQPLLRVPAVCGFLLLFSIVMGLVAAVKYFLKSWDAIGWVFIILTLSFLVERKIVDIRSVAYGLDYERQDTVPVYNYSNLKEIFTRERYENDKSQEEDRLTAWRARNSTSDTDRPPIVVVNVSGGGSRSAYWTFRALQYADSLSGGQLFKHTVMITGASGGMIGATLWRNLHDENLKGTIQNPYLSRYQDDVGKDLLNSIIFSLASVDLITPFNKVKMGGFSYSKDRGYAMEEELINNSEGLLGNTVASRGAREKAGIIPQTIFSGTVVNDGRKLLMTAQPAAYLTQPEFSLKDANPQIDAVDFMTFFKSRHAENLRFATAIRMNATFPFILPVVKLPGDPAMNVMDAGLRDNFGSEVTGRYLFAMRKWIEQYAGEVIQLEVRDTRENFVGTPVDESSLMGMLSDPIFSIQNRWEAFQSFNRSYMKDFEPDFLKGHLHILTMRYYPRQNNKNAELNFHLTQNEKEDLYKSIYHAENQKMVKKLMTLLGKH